MYLKKERFYLSECLYKSSIFIQYRYFKKRIIKKTNNYNLLPCDV